MTPPPATDGFNFATKAARDHQTAADTHEFKEYEIVRLATSAYEHLGLKEGEVGTIVDILNSPTLGYTVEFHDISPDNWDKVKTFEPYEIKMVAE